MRAAECVHRPIDSAHGKRNDRGLRQPAVLPSSAGVDAATHTALTQTGIHGVGIGRVVGQTPIYDVVVGNDEGQVPLAKLQSHIMKLPRNMSPSQVDGLEKRLGALSNRGVALPKGPMPAGAKLRNVQRTIRRR